MVGALENCVMKTKVSTKIQNDKKNNHFAPQGMDSHSLDSMLVTSTATSSSTRTTAGEPMLWFTSNLSPTRLLLFHNIQGYNFVYLPQAHELLPVFNKTSAKHYKTAIPTADWTDPTFTMTTSSCYRPSSSSKPPPR